MSRDPDNIREDRYLRAREQQDREVAREEFAAAITRSAFEAARRRRLWVAR